MLTLFVCLMAAIAASFTPHVVEARQPTPSVRGLGFLRADIARNQPMSFAVAAKGGNCEGCEWIAAQGRITSDTPEQFRRFLQIKEGNEEGSCNTVALNSPGGSPEAAMALGRIFREKGCLTMISGTGSDASSVTGYDYVSGSCESACALAFFGGKVRFAEGKLGVHQFTVDMRVPSEATEQALTLGINTTQLLQGLIIGYLLDMGIDPKVAQIAARTPPTLVHYFSPDELISLNIDTLSGRAGPWAIVPYKAGAVATSESRSADIIETRTIFCRGQPQPTYFATFSRRGGSNIYFDLDNVIGKIEYGSGQSTTSRLDREQCTFCKTTQDQGRRFFTVPIPSEIIDGLVRGDEIFVRIPLPHSNGRDFEMRSKLTSDERAIFMLVMRNCV